MKNNSESHPDIPVHIQWLKKLWAVLPSIILILFILSIAELASTCRDKKALLEVQKKEQMKKEQAPINVVVLPLKPATIRDRINFPGITQPWVQLNVLCEVNGKVLKKEKQEGEAISKGDIIARIDDRDYVNALNSAKASHNLAKASLIRLEGLSKSQLSTEAEVDSAVAQVAQTKAALDSALLNVERCTIKAPLSGTLNHLYIEKGQYLNHSDNVAEILQLDPIKVKVGIPESDVDAVRNISTFEIRIDALDNKHFTAAKYFLSKTAGTSARLFDLELVVANSQQEILPDMFTRVEIVKQVIQDALRVPMSAVISIDNSHQMYIVNGDKAHLRKVEIGLREGVWIQIKNGLKFGDNVIIEGQRYVNDGQPVKVIRRVDSFKELAQ